MDDETPPLSETQARQRRQEALRALAAQQQQGQQRDTPGAPSAAPTSSSPGAATTLGRPGAPAKASRSSGYPSPARGVVSARATRGRRRWLALVAVVLAAVVVAAGTLFWLRRPTSSPVRRAPATVPISLDSATQCPREAVWSPNGGQVAVLGYQQCGALGGFASAGSSAPVAAARTSSLLGDLVRPASGNTPTTGGVVLLYNADNGQLTKTIQLDPTILFAVVPASVRNDPVAIASVGFTYYALAWSPDGKQLAVSYDVNQQDSSNLGSQNVYGTGLALVRPANADVKLLPRDPSIPLYGEDSSSFHPQPALLWDLRAGTSTLVHVPQALSYGWQAGGALAPVVALPATPEAPPPAAPAGPIGNPIGGAAFSAWQAGYANYGDLCVQSPNSVDGPTSCCPITSFYQVGFLTQVAWSPDGRYLLQGIGNDIGALGKIAASQAPSPRPLPAGCPDTTLGPTLAQLPVRDRALATVLERLSPPPRTPYDTPPPASGPTSASFAWSPDGKRLAVMFQGAFGAQPGDPVIAVYDCASSKVLAHFSAQQILTKAQVPLNVVDNVNSVGIQSFAWSADSQRLMLLGSSPTFVLMLGPSVLGV